MDYLKHAVRSLSGKIFAARHEEKQSDPNRMDAYLNFLCKLFGWEDPRLSWLTFIFMNGIYLLIIYYDVRFYCCMFTFLLALFLLDFYGETFNVREEAQSISFQQISGAVRSTVCYLQVLKKDSHSSFCGIMVLCFLLMSFIGRMISGQVLGYFLLLAAFFGPYVVQQIPKEYRSKATQFLVSFRNTDGVVAEIELIPFIADKDFNAERDPDLDSLLTDRTQDSVTNSLVSGLSGMPSYLDADLNGDELEEEDLLPSRTSRAASYSAVDYSTDSDSDHKNIEFDSSHFNRDSSSDEEKNYSKGLRFSDVVDNKTVQTISQGLGSSLMTMGSNILSNVLSTASQMKAAATTPRQDSDSDFEIINTEDADDS